MGDQDMQAKPVAKSPFKLPTRQELEERRRQVESAKVELHFKPKGITLESSPSSSATASLDASATNSSHATQPLNAAPLASSLNPKPTPSSSSSSFGLGGASHASQLDDFGDLDDMPLVDDVLDDDTAETTGSLATTSTPTSVSNPPGGTSTATATKTAATTITTTTATTTATTTGTGTSEAAAPPTFVPRSKSTIVVNTSQRGNPLLQHIRNVPYEFGTIEPDYMVGLTSCVLFLSIRYHRLHPEYIYSRIAGIGKSFVLRVLLVLVDVETHQQAIRELTRVAVTSEFTLICCWSNEEAARYIETYKAYESKPPDAIRERVDSDYLSKLSDCLTQVRSVNKTDVVTLSSTFGSFQNIVEASADEIGLLPGFGEQKVKRLIEAFDQPFVVDPHKRKRRRG